MGLHEQIKKLEKEVNDGVETEEIETGAAETPADATDAPDTAEEHDSHADDADQDEEPGTAEAATAAAATTPPPAAAQSQGNADMARLRREKDAADRRARQVEQENAQLRQRQAQPAAPPAAAKPAAAADPEPDKATNYEGWLEWNLRQSHRANEELRSTLGDVSKKVETWEQKTQRENLEKQAETAFHEYEGDFAKTVQDYENVAGWGVQQIANSIRMLNPGIKGTQLQQAVKGQILRMAGQAEAQGYNPAEYLYHLALQSGYQAPAAAPAATETQPPAGAPQKLKPDLKQVAASQKKSGSPLAGGGSSGPTPLSKEHVGSKSFGFKDFNKLTPAQLRELEGMA
jgi:hypothetical protein